MQVVDTSFSNHKKSTLFYTSRENLFLINIVISMSSIKPNQTTLKTKYGNLNLKNTKQINSLN